MGPFELLGLEPRFDLELPALEARHRALSTALHPDKFVSASASERRLALGKAIEVNEAYRTLKDPVKRAEALLVQQGVPIGDAFEPRPSAELLLEMMEVREELAALRRTNDLTGLDRLASTMRTKEVATLEHLARGFEQAHGDTAKLQALLPALGQLRYFRRFFEELDATLDELSS